jgi:hypothetical protein
MPEYLFQHPKTNKVISVLQSAKDEHIYIDDNGVKWNRVWTVPNASIDTTNDGSLESFKTATSNKKGMTLGNMWDASRESSEKRAKVNGKDTVKEIYFKDYAQKRQGKKHLKDR